MIKRNVIALYLILAIMIFGMSLSFADPPPCTDTTWTIYTNNPPIDVSSAHFMTSDCSIVKSMCYKYVPDSTIHIDNNFFYGWDVVGEIDKDISTTYHRTYQCETTIDVGTSTRTNLSWNVVPVSLTTTGKYPVSVTLYDSSDIAAQIDNSITVSLITINYWEPSTTYFAYTPIQPGEIKDSAGNTITSLCMEYTGAIASIKTWLQNMGISATSGYDQDTGYSIECVSSINTANEFYAEDSCTQQLLVYDNVSTIFPVSDFSVTSSGSYTVTAKWKDTPLYADDADQSKALNLNFWSYLTSNYCPEPPLVSGDIYKGYRPYQILFDEQTVEQGIIDDTTHYTLYDFFSTNQIWISVGYDTDSAMVYPNVSSCGIGTSYFLVTDTVATQFDDGDIDFTKVGWYRLTWTWGDLGEFPYTTVDGLSTHHIWVHIYELPCCSKESNTNNGGVKNGDGSVSYSEPLQSVQSRGNNVSLSINYESSSNPDKMKLGPFGYGADWSHNEKLEFETKNGITYATVKYGNFATESFLDKGKTGATEATGVWNYLGDSTSNYATLTTKSNDGIIYRPNTWGDIGYDAFFFVGNTTKFNTVYFNIAEGQQGSATISYYSSGKWISFNDFDFSGSGSLKLSDAILSNWSSCSIGDNVPRYYIFCQLEQLATFDSISVYMDQNTLISPPNETDVLTKDDNNQNYYRITLTGATTHYLWNGVMDSYVYGGNTIKYYYNSSYSQLTGISDPSGRFTKIEYGPYGTVTAITDGTGRRTSFTYSSSTDLSEIHNPVGWVKYYYYDSYHRVTSIRDYTGIRESYYLDSIGRATARVYESGPVPEKWIYQYDSQNRKFTVKSPLGLSETKNYVMSDYSLTTTIGYSGFTTYHFMDLLGRVTASRNERGQTTLYSYNTNDKLIWMVTPSNLTTFYYYNTLGLQTAVRDIMGNYLFTAYGPYNRITAIWDNFGRYSYHYYDAYGQVTATERTMGIKTFAWFDQYGQVTATAGNSGCSCEGSLSWYDQYGNSTASKNALEQMSYRYYDDLGRLIQSKDAKNGITQYSYDTFGNTVSVKDPMGYSSYSYYDSYGRLTAQKDALNRIAYAYYDIYGRISTNIDSNGKKTQYLYDSFSRMTAEIRLADYQSDQATFYYYDQWDQLTTIESSPNYNAVDTSAIYAAFDWDTAANYAVITTKESDNILFNLSNILLNSGCGELNGYFCQTTKFSNIYFEIDTSAIWYREDPEFTVYYRNGNTNIPITLAYDSTNSFITSGCMEFPSSIMNSWDKSTISNIEGYWIYVHANFVDVCDQAPSIDVVSTYSYIPDSNKSYTRFYYDQWGRETAYIYSNDTITYSYDTYGRRISLKDPEGKLYTYGYNSTGSLASVSNWLNQTTYFDYDLLGRKTTVRNPNQTKSFYYYDTESRITTLAIKKNDGTLLGQYDYQYDVLGNRTQMIERNYPISTRYKTVYQYDALQRLIYERRSLISDDSEIYLRMYSYDSAGNRTQLTSAPADTYYTYDSCHQLIYSVINNATTQYSYDSLGNLTQKVLLQGQEYQFLWGYTFDSRGRLVCAGKDSSIWYKYNYDDVGNRTSRLDANGGKISYAYDGINVLREIHIYGTRTTVKAYTLNPGAASGQILSVWLSNDTATTQYWYHYDGLGNVIFLTDSVGNLVESYKGTYVMEGFGNIVDTSIAGGPNSEYPNPVNYYHLTTKEMEIPGYNGLDATGLYYFAARWYDPVIGRFITEDPYMYNNPYAYASNDPINRFDPNGLADKYCCDAILPDSPLKELSATCYAEAAPKGYSRDELLREKKAITDTFWVRKATQSPSFCADHGDLVKIASCLYPGKTKQYEGYGSSRYHQGLKPKSISDKDDCQSLKDCIDKTKESELQVTNPYNSFYKGKIGDKIGAHHFNSWIDGHRVDVTP